MDSLSVINVSLSSTARKASGVHTGADKSNTDRLTDMFRDSAAIREATFMLTC